MRRCDPTKKQAGQFSLHKQAFTIIELLVTIAVIGLLAALLLPAISAARESARRAACANNLHQLGIALHAYESAYRCLPPGGGSFSVHAKILSNIDNSTLFNSLNFSVGATSLENETCSSIGLAQFVCPSDVTDVKRGTNYPFSRGVDSRNSTDTGAFSFWSPVPTRLADFTDGTGTTVACAEWVLGPGGMSLRDPRGTIYLTRGQLNSREMLDVFLTECGAANPTSAVIAANSKGTVWLESDYIHTLYNHNIKPNGISCMSDNWVQPGAYTAGSRHVDGVNVLFVDGHSRFFRDGLDLSVWRSLGTRNGSEVVQGNY